jgi:hypothetical protein
MRKKKWYESKATLWAAFGVATAATIYTGYKILEVIITKLG